MTMLKTKTAIEEALYNGSPLPFEAMVNCYTAVQYFLLDWGDRIVDTKIDSREVRTE